jgi:hypothetical protein
MFLSLRPHFFKENWLQGLALHRPTDQSLAIVLQAVQSLKATEVAGLL